MVFDNLKSALNFKVSASKKGVVETLSGRGLAPGCR
jgi:hypothetical protein